MAHKPTLEDVATLAGVSIATVDRVVNRRAAIGGVASETVDEARLRGPLALRTRDRAVTAEDYEQLARAAAPQVARVRTVPARSDDEAGGVRRDAQGDELSELIPEEQVVNAAADERGALHLGG